MMPHNRMTRAPQRGFTLIELLVTLAIAATLALVAVPGLQSYQRNAEVVSAGGTVQAAVNAARSEAMKRGMNVLMVPTNGSAWSAGWTIFVDRNRDFALGEADFIVQTQMGPAETLQLVGTGSAGGAAPYLLFDASGYSRTKAGGFAAVTLSINRKDDVLTTDYTRLLKVAQTGRVRICKPSSSSDANCSVSEED